MPRKSKTKAGEPILMPSIKLDLGKYVVVRGPRKDGTFRVLFEVPDRLRPSGWLPTRPLPRDSAFRKGDLNDPEEVARIIQDAKDLNAELHEARMGREGSGCKPYSLRDLAWRWQQSAKWTDDFIDGGYKERTKQFYAKMIRIYIDPWSISEGDKDVRRLSHQGVQAFIDLYKRRPYVQRHLRATLLKLLGHAKRLGWISENPAKDIEVQPIRKKPKVLRWSEADVDVYVQAAEARGWTGLARLILGLWETCARPTDAIEWRRGEHYNPASGRFDWITSKTGEEVADLPVSDRLRAMLNEPATLFLVFRPDGTPYKPVRDDQKLTDDFAALRSIVVADGGPYRLLRQLRHAGIQDATDKGASREDIQGVTAHVSEQTVKRYVRRSAKKAEKVQKIRGIVE